MFTAPIATVAACSGLILWHEWRRDPVEQSEYREWTNEQHFYAIVLAVSFFADAIVLAARYLATWNEA